MLLFNPIPLPRKLFSLTPKPRVLPDVPTPAPAVISPVGFSSTLILIILASLSLLSIISDFTSLKKLRPFILFIDLLNKISLNG